MAGQDGVAGSAGVVLAGGRSTRMGVPKAGLEWHGSTLLRRTVMILARAGAGLVVVVRAAGQELPSLPARVEVTEDPRPGRGPLQGIAAGLAAVSHRADVAFVCATDLPFLHPAYVRAVLAALRPGIDVALPVAAGYPQPLAAAYRTALAPLAQLLVSQDRLRPAELFAACAVSRLDEAALRSDPALAALDPLLDSLRNINDPAGYAAARGRPAPEVAVSGGAVSGLIRAATLAEAATAAGLVPGPGLVATVSGGQDSADWELPLAAGDSVRFRPAG